MIKKDPEEGRIQCQWGINCKYLRAQVLDDSGEGCKYYHPAQHYQRLQDSNGKAGKAGVRVTAGGGNFDPLRSQARAPAVVVAPPTAAIKSSNNNNNNSNNSSALRASHSVSTRSPLTVVRLLRSESLRRSPSFGDVGVEAAAERELCCGHERRVTDGSVEWLRCETSPQHFAWLPLLIGQNCELLSALQQMRVFRLLERKTQSHLCLLSRPSNHSLAAGTVVEAVATVVLPKRVLVQTPVGWLDVSSGADELAIDDSLIVCRVQSPVTPRIAPTIDTRCPAAGKSLEAGTVVCVIARVSVTHDGQRIEMCRIAGNGGWIASADCWTLQMGPGGRYRFAENAFVTDHPSTQANVVGSVPPGTTARMLHTFRTQQLGGDVFGYLTDGRGWVLLKSQFVDEAVNEVSEAEGDDSQCCVCLERPRTAALVHGDSAHQCCCMQCAVMLQASRAPCPICRASIDRVIANVFK